MRFATLKLRETSRAAVFFEDHYRLTPYRDLAGLLSARDGDIYGAADELVGAPIQAEEAILAQAVRFPSKIICLGMNYADHLAELGKERTKHPTLFAKYSDTLMGPYDKLVLPEVSSQVDWEVELGVIIGKAGKHISEEKARDHIAGFVVVNDFSMRDFQRRTSQFVQGKIFEATTPVGPWLVTPDEVDFAEDLSLECEVDGVVMQSSRTSKMIFDIFQSISYISQIVTLYPGDLVSTGTPAGVGEGRDPQVYLRPGQVVRSSVEGVGELVNEVVAPS